MSLYDFYYFVTTAADDAKAALRTFDEHLHLMTLIEPCCIQEKLQTAKLISENTAKLTSMEKLLEEIRSSIELKGTKMFLNFVDLLRSEGRYEVFACHIFSK